MTDLPATSPFEKYVRDILPNVYLCEFGYEGHTKWLIYARRINCPALIPSKKSAEEAWKAAARILGYYSPMERKQ